MKWFHRVKCEWLEERQKFLTASDICKMLPVTPTGRPRSGIDEAILKVWANKQRQITEEDITSTGVMARGHILEPYAIEEFNKLGVFPSPLRHWDDMLVYTVDGVSCSPDALNQDMPVDAVSMSESACVAMYHGEVKAYGADSHYAKGLGDKMTLDERWQVATAFYVMPRLIQSALILFNPAAAHPMFVHLYTPAELKDELEMIEEVAKIYYSKAADFKVDSLKLCPGYVRATCPLEDEIIAEILEAEAGILDPNW